MGGDLSIGTTAEVVCAISAASLEAPPDTTACVLYDRLFRRVMPEAAKRLTRLRAVEPYDGACAELERTIRRKLIQQRRVDL